MQNWPFSISISKCEQHQLARAHDIDWEAVEHFATQEIIQCLQFGELFMSTQHMRD
jgi:hypothetical protein